jgi:2-polyprenyl-6-methoxyphenol hydroxylase-like FAD-dependent oxidoreductase
VPVNGFEIYIRPDRVTAALPTHNDQTLVLAAWPIRDFDDVRVDVEGNYLKTLEVAPEFAARVRAGRRESRFHSSGALPGFFRRPYGPGWALVGDAGYTIDPSTAQGITDAFMDAERLAWALDEALSDRRAYDDALAEFQQTRDEEVAPLYELTFSMASFEPPPPEFQQILGAAAGNQRAMDAFASMFAGVLPVPEFFSPQHVESILQAA